MRIIIDKEFYIDVDSNNHTLMQKKQGNKRDVTVGYFTSVKNCLLKMIKIKETEDSKTVTIKQFIDDLKDHERRLEEIVNRINQEP